MTYGFIAAALALGLVALVLAFWPLIRRSPTLGGVLAGAMLVVVTALYLLVGTPAALDPANVRAPDTLAGAMERLEAELARKPDQPEGWRLLADAYRAQGRLVESARAFAQAARYAPNDADVLAQAAEARARLADGRPPGDNSPRWRTGVHPQSRSSTGQSRGALPTARHPCG